MQSVLTLTDFGRERGITIVECTLSLKDGEIFIFSTPIDTPDIITHEVLTEASQSKGSGLVVDARNIDASQRGLADDDFGIVRVINKIDLPSAELRKSKRGLKMTLIDVKMLF